MPNEQEFENSSADEHTTPSVFNTARYPTEVDLRTEVIQTKSEIRELRCQMDRLTTMISSMVETPRTGYPREQIRPRRLVNEIPAAEAEGQQTFRGDVTMFGREQRKVKPIDPPSFRGDQKTAEIWLRRYDSVAEANGWNQKDKLARVQFYLSGNAESWYMGMIAPLRIQDWTVFEECFR